MTTITIVDESMLGETHAWSLDFLNETVSLRELIRQRIYQEVTEYNARLSGHFRGLVQPTHAERTDLKRLCDDITHMLAAQRDRLERLLLAE